MCDKTYNRHTQILLHQINTNYYRDEIVIILLQKITGYHNYYRLIWSIKKNEYQTNQSS